MKKIKHPITIIFGAGASRGGLEKGTGAPPPVDKDFFEIANQLTGHGTPKLTGRILDQVWKLYGKIHGIGLETFYRDLETRDAIGRFAKTSNQPMNWRLRQKELEELIRRIFVQTTVENIRATTVKPRKSEIHEKILKLLERNDSIITFNYDLVIEESFLTANLWNPIDGYGVNTLAKTKGWAKRWLEEKQYKHGTKSYIKLLKLHGSLNWESHSGVIRLKPKPYLVSMRNREPRFEKISILAPGWNKRIDKNPYKKFWREARLRLEKCKTLIILGYSLPETDLMAHALLAEVVRTRVARTESLQQLHLADHNEQVKERFIKLFTPILGSRGEIFQYSDINHFNEEIKTLA